MNYRAGLWAGVRLSGNCGVKQKQTLKRKFRQRHQEPPRPSRSPRSLQPTKPTAAYWRPGEREAPEESIYLVSFASLYLNFFEH